MSRGAKLGLFAVVAVVVIGGLIMVGSARKANRATDVRMEPVGKRDLVAAVTSSGQIEAKSDRSLSSEVTARILKIHVKEGDMVKEGELLVELDQAQFKGAVERSQAAIAQANAASVQARANRDQAKRALDRQVELKRTSPTLVTDESVENARTALDVAEANLKSSDALLDQAKATLKEAQDNLARTMIYSPISGRVVRLAVQEGEVAVPGTFSKDVGLLMRIADLSEILAKVKVDETDIVRLAMNDSVSVTIDAFPDTSFVGRVTKIGNSATTATTTGTSTDKAVDFEVEVTLTNPPHDVRPDLSMTSRIITSVRKGALSIPIIALTARAMPNTAGDTKAATPIAATMPATPGDTTKKKVKEQEGVFVVQNGIARFRPVKVGITGDEYVEVLDGVKEGETVVAGTYQAIRDMKDSTRVKAVTTPGAEVKKP
jgi:HlyD family secretion protein